MKCQLLHLTNACGLRQQKSFVQNQTSFENVVIRLGGFHTLISFLGSIGELMSASGLQEVMETIYAPNPVSHMMTGKAFDCAMRGHLLVAAAFFTILVSESLPCELPCDYIKVDLTGLSAKSTENMEIETLNPDLQELISLHDALYDGKITTTDIEASTAVGRLAKLLEQKKK